MNTLIRWFAENKTVANILMVLIVGAALIVTPKISKKIFPEAQLQGFLVTSAYPGASANEIEKTLCIPIENTLRRIDGIWIVLSTIKNQACVVTIYLEKSNIKQKVFSQVESALKGIDVPQNAIRPIAKDLAIEDYVARLIVHGNAKFSDLHNQSKSIIQDLNNLGIQDIKHETPLELNTLIEIPRINLEKYLITFPEIVDAIRKNSQTYSSGEIDSADGKLSIQSVGSVHNTNDLSEIILRSQDNGAQLRLGDIANIKSHQATSNRHMYYDGKPAVNLIVNQGKNANLTEVSKKLHEYIENKNARLPANIKLTIDGDASVFFNARIMMLAENAIYGLIFVFITLLLFLNARLSLWVTVGIPISFAGALVVLYFSGYSLNMISTFSFLIVLGIVVDDAIVVGESVYDSQENFIRGTEGAVQGSIAVAKPVFYAVLTTIIMFMPLLFIPGTDGQLLRTIPIVAIATLIFSLVECFLILPAHLAHQSKTKKADNTFSKINKMFSSFVDKNLKSAFSKLLNIALQWRYAVVASFVIITSISAALVASGWINVRFMSTVEADEAFVTVELPQGSPFAQTQNVVKRIETAALDLQKELRQEYGSEQILHMRTYSAPFGDHSAQIFLAFPSRDERKLSTEEVAKRWREKVGEIPEVRKIEFAASFNKPGPAIDIQLSSANRNQLIAATQDLQRNLYAYPATYAIQNDIKHGNQEVDITLKDNASGYNISIEQVALVINQAFNGMRVSPVDENTDETLLLRLPENERNTLWHLEQLKVPSKNAGLIPLHHIAELNFKTGESEIIRYNFKRSVNVEAYVDESQTPSAQIIEDLEERFLNQLADKYPDVSWQPAGALLIKQDTQQTIVVGSSIALLLMFLLITMLFKSATQTLIVLSAVPFGLVGALLGHGLFNLDITIWSIAGMIAVSGIVVNDNVVLIAFINEQKELLNSVKDAVLDASVQRFRPILLTSLTTIMGLTPIMFEKSWEAQFIIPMVVSIGFGVLFATFVSLVLVPCLYMLYNDVRNHLSR